MERRTLLKTSLATSLVVGVGMLIPGRVLAVYPEAAFKNQETAGALTDLHGVSDYTESADIKIKAPAIADNGAEVPIQVISSIAGIESITIVAMGNPTPIIASFNLAGAEGFVSTRIKMDKTSDILAVVKAGGALHAVSQEVKVAIVGSGG